jgi:hypothetical protein
VVSVAIFALLGSRLTLTSHTPLTGCVVDHGSGGGLGLVRWARRLGFTVQPLDVPTWDAPEALTRTTGNCIITMGNNDWGPLDHGLTDERWAAVRQWLTQGNTLIVITTAPKNLPAAVSQDISLSVMDTEAGKEPSQRASIDGELERVPALELGSLSVAKNGPRGAIPGEQLWERGPNGRRRPAEEATKARWQWAADDRGVVLYRIPVGQGTIYVLLDDVAWTNAGLDQGENAQVLAGILRPALAGGVLAIDEYRHGHGRAESFLTFLMNLPGARSVLWLILLWCLLFFVSRNYRLEPLRADQRVERRTAREYIDAVAQLHERARAAPLAVEAVARRLRHLSRGSPTLLVSQLLAQADEYVADASRPARPTQSMQLVNELIRLRKQLYGSRTFS